MGDTPFPEVTSSRDLDNVRTSTYIECVGCINLTPVVRGMDLVEWAEEHKHSRPWHRRFRILEITNFSVPPAAPPAGYPDVAYSDVP